VPRLPRSSGEIAGLVVLLSSLFLVYRTVNWLGGAPTDVVFHGAQDDWGWLLALTEATRASLLQHHQFPGWMPFIEGGLPLAAHPDSMVLYPPSLLVWLLGCGLGVKLWILLHLGALVVGCWWAGRRAGLGPVEANAAGLLAVTSSQLAVRVAEGHLMFLALCWLPWMWVAADGRRWRWAGICLAMTLLSAFHYVFVFGVIWLLAFAGFRWLSPRRGLWLGLFLLANVLLCGQSWATWPLLLLGIGVLALQKPAAKGTWHQLWPAGAALALGLALAAPRLTMVGTLMDRSSRLEAQRVFSADQQQSLIELIREITGAADVVGHESHAILYSPFPLILAAIGVGVALRKHCAFALVGLLFLNLGLGGSTPVNLLQVAHRIPVLSALRMVERYSLVWVLFLGWFAAWGARALWDVPRPAWVRWPVRAGLLVGVVWHLAQALPPVALTYDLGSLAQAELPAAGAFTQVSEDLSGWQAVRLNRGLPRVPSSTPLREPTTVAVVGEPGYQGEITMEDGTPVPARITPNRIAFEAPADGTLIVNQNAFRGWRHQGRPADASGGLLAAKVKAGSGELRYRSPGLWLGGCVSLLAVVVAVWPRRKGRDRRGRRGWLS